MSTDIALVETVDDRRGFYRIAEQLAHKIHDTEFVPSVYRKRPMAILAAVLYGHELGLEPLTAINTIDVIQGRPSLNKEAQRGLVLAAGHAIDIVEHTSERCTVHGTRNDATGVTLEVTWTLDDAKRAGLLSKDNWKQYPRAMLLARATGELCGAIFADVIGGFASAVVDVTGVDPTDDVEYPATQVDPARCALDDDELEDAELYDGPDEPAGGADRVGGGPGGEATATPDMETQAMTALEDVDRDDPDGDLELDLEEPF